MKVTLCERGKEQVDGKDAIEAEASKPPSLHTWRSKRASLGHVGEEELFFFSCERGLKRGGKLEVALLML